MPVNKVRRRGSYAPLSAHYYKDDAIIQAGEKAELLFVRGLAWCADTLSDGFISDAQLLHVGIGMSNVKARARRLVEVGKWDRVEGGFQVRSWLAWNKSREAILGDLRKDADRKGEQGDELPFPPEPPPDDAPPDEGDIHADSERNQNGHRPESDPTPNQFQPSRAGARGPAHRGAPAHSRAGQGRAGQNGGYLGGEGSASVDGRDQGPPPPARCGRNHDDEQPCRRCAELRKAAEQAEADAADAAKSAARAKRAEVGKCAMCDADGWLREVSSARPVSPFRRCDHQSDHQLQVKRAREAS